MMLSSSFDRKDYLGVRYEKGPAPELKGSANEINTAEGSGTYGLQFAKYLDEKLMVGAQLGPLVFPVPLYLTAHLQYDFFRANKIQLSIGGLLGAGNNHYGLGLTGAYKLSNNFRIFATAQWINERIAYESAKGHESDNFVEVRTQYSQIYVGAEFLLEKNMTSKEQLSLSFALGYQDFLNYRIESEDHPSDFRFQDGLSSYIEVRLYFD